MTKIIIGSIIAWCFALPMMVYTINNHPDMVTCIEHVTIDGQAECSIFEWRGQTYATDAAETYPEL